MFPTPSSSVSEWYCSSGILLWKFPKSAGSYTLVGRSRAADATSLYIPELDALLDCGCLVTHSRPLHVFLTHSHTDHCHDVTRVISGWRPPEIYLPASSVSTMSDFLQKFQTLRANGRTGFEPQESPSMYKLIGVTHGDLLSFRQTMKVRVFDMDHSVPCCGYGFYECRKKLKKEYEHLSTKEIATLRHIDKNIELSEERLFPLFIFMGDTTAVIFERYEAEFSQFPLIIVECSFIDNEQHSDRAADVKHVIWDELQPFVLQHPEITFVLIHFSQQYKSHEIKEFFQRLNLPNVVAFI